MPLSFTIGTGNERKIRLSTRKQYLDPYTKTQDRIKSLISRKKISV